ncbi:MAG: aldehyde dehydrogenase family protein [Phenylobacterium sp.]|nr:aldehyde dehydrogenase family protein [Phenylobacterium sp.]
MNLPLKIANSVFVAGEWIKASGEPEAVINPATEEVIGFAPVGGKAEVAAAIAAAREAFDKGPWPRTSPAERAAKLRELHAGLMARRADIMRLITDEAGAVAAIAPIQFDFPMHLAMNAIEEGSRSRDIPMPPATVPNMAGGKSFVGGIVRREPVGVVAAITPYNFPYLLNVVKMFPALVTGNTVVLKPSPYTPFSALIIAEVVAEVGFPPGVINIVTGGKEVGEMMTTDPRVDLITFTGSDAVGSAIMAQGAPSLKRLHFELGGKSAHIVRGDADLQAAVAGGMGYLTHSGQGCANVTRHLVHNSVRKAYVEMLAAAHRALKIGNPADPSVNFGPLIRESQRARTEFYVAEGLKGGATLVTGGRRPAGFDKGFFYEPTLFDDVDNKSRLAQEEVFGPVGAVIGFDTDEQAIEMANDSQFGLSGSVWSSNLAAAFDIACAVRTGGISINGGGAAPGAPVTPFGGFKRSGFGREWGVEGLNAFTELKTISFRQI